MALELSARTAGDCQWRARDRCRHGHAHRRRHRAADGRAIADPHRLGAYRRRALSWRFRHALCRKAGRGRRQGCGARNAQCRLARSHRLLEEPPAAARTRHGAADDGRLSHARLRAKLDLRALSGRPPPGARQRCRLGREQCGRVLQFGARRTHQPLWRFPRYRLRHCRLRALLRLPPPGKPPRHRCVRRLRSRRGVPCVGSRLADPRQPLRSRAWRCGRRGCRH